VVKGLGHGIRLAGVAAQLHEGKAAVRSAVLGLAIGEAGQASEAAPVGGAKVPRGLGSVLACLSQA
jgi:hypothetical protein